MNHTSSRDKLLSKIQSLPVLKTRNSRMQIMQLLPTNTLKETQLTNKFEKKLINNSEIIKWLRKRNHRDAKT